MFNKINAVKETLNQGKIVEIEMKIIIVGDGKVGLAITDQLTKEGHDLVIVDSNPAVLQKSVELYDVQTIVGNGASKPVLREAGAETADLVIAAASSDELNMLTCIIAKRLGVKSTIARVRNPEYHEQIGDMRAELGLSMLINPDLSAANEIYNVLQFPSFLQRDSFAKGRVEIVELKIDSSSKLVGIPLSKLYKILSVKVLICAVERKGDAFIPRGDFVLEAGDHIHVTADARQLARVVQDFGLKYKKIENVMIIGGSRIAYYLSRMLISSGIGVKIVEKDRETCNQLAEMLPEAMVIFGDGSDQRLLLEEGIKNTDALITLTSMDEENIFVSLYGTHIKIPHIITKVNQMEYADVVESVGIESAVSPKMLCALEVARYVRAMANTKGGSVVTMHELVGGKVQALEFTLTEKTRHLNKQLMELPIKKNILIACIFRKGKPIIPQGSNHLREGDSVVVVVQSETLLVDFNEIFEG